MKRLVDRQAELDRAVRDTDHIWHRFQRAETDAEADEHSQAYVRAHHAIRAARAALTLRDAR